MKPLFAILALTFFALTYANAQSGRQVHGTVIDTTKQGVPAATIVLTSDQHDSTTTVTDLSGKFVFPSVKGSKVDITVSKAGYPTVRKHYELPGDTPAADLGEIILNLKPAGPSVLKQAQQPAARYTEPLLIQQSGAYPPPTLSLPLISVIVQPPLPI